jgi:C-terminal processing protease CtpA/Prc
MPPYTKQRREGWMSDVVLAALIGAVASIIVNLISASNQRKKKAVDDAVKDERLENRLKSIEKKLDTHNGYAEKLGDIQTDIAVIKNDIHTLYMLKGEKP